MATQRKRKPQTKFEVNLVSLVERFQSEDACRLYLEDLRWPDGATCPRCQSKSVSRIDTRDQLDCNSCRYRFSVLSGTIFHDTHLPLWKWFLATYMMMESKKGISALQLKRTLNVAYKTAWYLCHRIREAMSDPNAPLLSGKIEVDETFIGGKVRGSGRGYRGNKTVVAGVVQRGGQIRLQVIQGTDRETLHAVIKKHASEDTAVIFTDEWPAYKGIADEHTRHETVNHRMEEWVRGDAHTQTVENVWSLLKRAIIGSYHQVSAKHLDRYLEELEWRFNNRDNPHLFRETVRKLMNSGNLEYKQLTAS